MTEAATLLGRTYIHPGDTTPYYTSPTPRPSEDAVFSVEATHVVGTPTVVLRVEESNDGDASSWATAGTFANITDTGVKTLEVTGLKERYRLAVSFSGGSVGHKVHLLIPDPSPIPD